MPQSLKHKDEDEPVEKDERSACSEDQELRKYYYDDAHGYEDFVDDDESDDEKHSDDITSSDVR